MTIDEFMKLYNIKNAGKVEKWIEEGLLPGTYKNNKNEWILSKYAHPPYTESRAKKASAIYKSIVNGCNKRKGICAQLFHLTEEEFEIYIYNLKKAGLITVKKDQGYKFYFATPISESYLNNQTGLKKIIRTIMTDTIDALASGTVKAIFLD